MKIYKIKDIINKLDLCIDENRPFNLIRFGDGGLKFINAVLTRDIGQLKQICKKEGIPMSKIFQIFELWGYYARRADFIDTPEVYYNGKFWPRQKKPNKSISEKTDDIMRNWKEIYACAEFDNDNYCNPESNYLMVLKFKNSMNLLDVMESRKLCIITACSNLGDITNIYDVDVIKIVGHFQDHFNNSFESVISTIKEKASYYDLFLIAAGELGRIYSGLVKEHGGRAVDIGFVADFWGGDDIHPRLIQFMCRNENNPLELVLTDDGKEYLNYI